MSVVSAAAGKGRKQDFPGWPIFEPDEIAAAVRVLQSGKVNYWTGQEGRTFEREFAAFVNCRYAVAVANGSVALELALHALGIGLGDEVVTTARSFIASASCAAMRGARPVFADVDRNSQNITAETVRAALTSRTKAIIAVHLAGWPCEMDSIQVLAREHGLKVVEDCAQACGAHYKGKPVGSFSDAAAFSFCQDKIMTTGGEGGMLTTNSGDVWERAWSYKDHGKNAAMANDAKWRPAVGSVHDSLGTNWRITEIQAAIGRVALPKIPAWVAARRRHAETLLAQFSEIPGLRVPVPPEHVGHAYYRACVFINPETLRSGWDRDRIRQAVETCGIPCFNGISSEIYMENAFAEIRPAKRLPSAASLSRTCLTFLVHPTLTEKHMLETARCVREVMTMASR
jgi:hypothetical protein